VPDDLPSNRPDPTRSVPGRIPEGREGKETRTARYGWGRGSFFSTGVGVKSRVNLGASIGLPVEAFGAKEADAMATRGGPSRLERELADPWRKEGSGRMVIYTPEVLRCALHNAIGQGRREDVELCVERGASLEWRDEGEAACGMTVFHLAVCCEAVLEDKMDLLKYFLEQKCNVDAIDYVESTPLHAAAAMGEPKVVEILVKNGASPFARDAEGLTPLHLAANGGHLAAAKVLTANWAPVDATDCEDEGEEDEMDGVNEAFKRQQKRTGKKRVAAPGASLYIARRGTPLHVCAAANRLSIAKHLVCDAGADVNSQEGPQKSTPLHVASRCGYAKMCKLLLENGADVNAGDGNLETPLMRAVEGGHVDIVCLLLERGSDVCAENQAGLTALHIAAALARKELFPLLVERGANPNSPCSKQYKDWDGGRTPVHYAAHNGDLDAFRCLLTLGGDARALSKVGWPSLFYAVEAKNLDVSEFIMDEDLKLELHCTVSGNRTPLMVAAMQDWKEGATAILKRYPFTLNWQDDIGRTALHWASLRTSTGVMEVLYAAGAKKDLLDKDGKKAGELYTGFVRPPPQRQWEEERKGAMGESHWDYTQVMENTAFRYVRKAMAAKRTREIAREKQCAWCKRYTFEAKRCGACKNAFYCSSACQKKDWNEGGHRLQCFTRFVDPSFVSQHLEDRPHV